MSETLISFKGGLDWLKSDVNSPVGLRGIVPDIVVSLPASLLIDLGCHVWVFLGGYSGFSHSSRGPRGIGSNRAAFDGKTKQKKRRLICKDTATHPTSPNCYTSVWTRSGALWRSVWTARSYREERAVPAEEDRLISWMSPLYGRWWCESIRSRSSSDAAFTSSWTTIVAKGRSKKTARARRDCFRERLSQ